MQRLKISIIVATFNSANTIKDTLDSIVSQTYDYLEVIIQDGGSTDSTLDIAKSYMDDRFIIIQEEDNGLYDAMNKGISRTTGNIIGILNSDDVFYDSEVLANVVSTFSSNPSIDLTYGDLHYVDQSLSKVIRNWKSSDFKKRFLYTAWQPPHPTVYLRSEVYKRIGKFNTNYSITADFDLMFRAFYVHCLESVYMNKVLIKMRIGGESNKSWTNRFISLRENINIYNKHGFWYLGVFAIAFRLIGRLPQYKL